MGERSAARSAQKLHRPEMVPAKRRTRYIDFSTQVNRVKYNKLYSRNRFAGHPNCRLFITHGGILSVIESIYHGVPMLSVPVFGDQKHNSIEVQSRGFALHVPYFELTAEAFGENLQKLLKDSRLVMLSMALNVSFTSLHLTRS